MSPDTVLPVADRPIGGWNRMNKRDLVETISEEARLTKAEATRAIDAFVHAIHHGLSADGRVALQGFGTFSLSERKAKRIRNPQRGGTMEIPARRVARFTPGHELRSAIERA